MVFLLLDKKEENSSEQNKLSDAIVCEYDDVAIWYSYVGDKYMGVDYSALLIEATAISSFEFADLILKLRVYELRIIVFSFGKIHFKKNVMSQFKEAGGSLIENATADLILQCLRAEATEELPTQNENVDSELQLVAN